jgi:hypothetical protein
MIMEYVLLTVINLLNYQNIRQRKALEDKRVIGALPLAVPWFSSLRNSLCICFSVIYFFVLILCFVFNIKSRNVFLQVEDSLLGLCNCAS